LLPSTEDGGVASRIILKQYESCFVEKIEPDGMQREKVSERARVCGESKRRMNNREVRVLVCVAVNVNIDRVVVLHTAEPTTCNNQGTMMPMGWGAEPTQKKHNRPHGNLVVQRSPSVPDAVSHLQWSLTVLVLQLKGLPQ
jgi:hypothetical protein